ncbi:MAG: hypothetical protein Ta2E_13350 [Mycoplasmoidaceae bacterium]|nr:MAG: hypothetical protein Ta2E_13350 [Mycoplasmoidaceae bacterium]
MNLSYCKRNYFQSNDPFGINSRSYNVSLLCGIKEFQLPITSIEVETTLINKEETMEKINYVVMMWSNDNYNSIPVFLFMF